MAVAYPKLNQFLDYRTFLIAHAQEQKRRNPQWSYGAWAKRLGLGGTASITRIIHGDRHPGPKLLEKLISYFGFNAREIEYFKDLVQLDRLKTDPKMTQILLEKLGKKHQHDMQPTMDEKAFQAISNWYFLAIREMVKLKDFKPDPTWISERLRFKVTNRQINQALEILRELGLIGTDGEGRTCLQAGKLETTSEAAAAALKRYQEEMLENAKQSLSICSSELQKMTSQTIALNSNSIGKAIHLVQEFQERFFALIQETAGDQIFQFQIQFFPLTRQTRNTEQAADPREPLQFQNLQANEPQRHGGTAVHNNRPTPVVDSTNQEQDGGHDS